MYSPLAFGFGGPVDLLIVGILVLLPTIFWIVEIIDAIRRDFAEPSEKIIWLVVIVLTHFLGALIYYFAGKPRGTLRQ
jgi:hypothetical protein